MQMNFFDRILVPVDFTINTEVAVKKAIDLATPGISVVHLLHVTTSGQVTDNRMLQWKDSIQECRSGIEVQIDIITGTHIENTIIAFARQIRFSLIIIGKNNHHSFFPFLNTVFSPTIAEETGCAVLTVKPGSLRKGMGTVVMPVADFYPRRKIELLSSLSTRAPLNVHLLTILNVDQHPDDHSASALLQSMRSIRNKFQCNVQYSLIHADNKAIAALHYAEKVNADMLLVNPETEATITTWMNKKDITDVLKPASQLQVFSIYPQL
jgi:nucleotide-binding universal stress UspA family protein